MRQRSKVIIAYILSGVLLASIIIICGMCVNKLSEKMLYL